MQQSGGRTSSKTQKTAGSHAGRTEHQASQLHYPSDVRLRDAMRGSQPASFIQNTCKGDIISVTLDVWVTGVQPLNVCLLKQGIAPRSVKC